MMKTILSPIIVACILLAVVVSCSVTSPATAEDTAFSQVRTVLEANCVHCHGDNRLSHMPSIQDTDALAKLIAAGGWIVPGKPEKSRLFQVVTFPDEIPGVMPPTGHAISKGDIEILRTWILSGAPVPRTKIILKPRGRLPRSI